MLDLGKIRLGRVIGKSNRERALDDKALRKLENEVHKLVQRIQHICNVGFLKNRF